MIRVCSNIWPDSIVVATLLLVMLMILDLQHKPVTRQTDGRTCNLLLAISVYRLAVRAGSVCIRLLTFSLLRLGYLRRLRTVVVVVVVVHRYLALIVNSDFGRPFGRLMCGLWIDLNVAWLRSDRLVELLSSDRGRMIALCR